MKLVYSTLATDMLYTVYVPGTDPKQLSVVEKQILIKGGANVVGGARKTKYDVEVPVGTINEVSDEDLALLNELMVFKLHKENGFIYVAEKASAPIEKVVEEKMEARDASAQLNEESYKDSDLKPIKNKGAK